MACVKWAEEDRGLLLVGSANGARYTHGGRTARAMQARGCHPGAPDLLILNRGADGSIALAVEFKIGQNKPTELQAAWGERAEKYDVKYAVVYSFEEFQRAVQAHLGETTPDCAAQPKAEPKARKRIETIVIE